MVKTQRHIAYKRDISSPPRSFQTRPVHHPLADRFCSEVNFKAPGTRALFLQAARDARAFRL